MPPLRLNFISLLSLLTILIGNGIQIHSQRTAGGHIYTSYHKGIVCNAALPFAEPKSLQDIQSIVRFAINTNLTVKPFGSLHSTSDIICTTGIPVKMDGIAHFSYDPRTKYATVGAGMKLHQLMDKLHREGRALLGIPAYGGITVGGGIGTGAHGSSLIFPSTLSDQMAELRFVDGLGTLRKVSEGKVLRAFKTNLGLLGIVYEVVLKTVAQYKIESVTEPVSDTILDNATALVEIARTTPFFQFWWFPTSEKVVMTKGSMVSPEIPGECQINIIPETSRSVMRFHSHVLEFCQSTFSLGLYLFQKVMEMSMTIPFILPGRISFYSLEDRETRCSSNSAIGFSHKMLSNTCDNCFWEQGEDSVLFEESEVVIPLEELEGALASMKTIFKEHPVHFYGNGIFFRFMTSSEGLLSVNRKESVAMEWLLAARKDRYGKPRYGMHVAQLLQQILVSKHRGLTHWAKNGLHYSSPEMIRLQHQENHHKFASAMDEMDPRGVFLNDFGRRLRFGQEEVTRNPQVKHCALSADHCICQSDNDCGAGGPEDHKCGKLYGYSVCMAIS